MKKIFQYSVITIAVVLTVASCRKNDKIDLSTLPFLGGDTWTQDSIDNWIMDSLTTPYNIDVKYKYDEFVVGESNLSQTLVPVKEELVVPALSTIKKIWIDTYVKEGGSAFVKTMTPKEIALIGSLSYHNGTVTLGETEGNEQILLYNMNAFSTSDRAGLMKTMHTVEHEFGHILNHSKLYDASFKQITPGGYTSDWNQIKDDSAHKSGFITPYAMDAPDEDFVETLSTLLVQGEVYFDSIVNAVPATGQAALLAKKSAVINYMKTDWNIDLVALQADVKIALDIISPPPPPPPLSSKFGYGNVYSMLASDSSDGQTSASFITAFNTANAQLKAYSNNGGRYIDSVTVSFSASDTLLLFIRYLNPSSPTSSYPANFKFHITYGSDGELSLGDLFIPASGGVTADGNARTIGASVKPLTDFFANKTFIARWPDGMPDDSAPVQIGGLYLTSDESAYFLGTLE